MERSKNYTDVIIFLIVVLAVGMLLGFILGQGLTMKNTYPVSENVVQIYGKNYFYK